MVNVSHRASEPAKWRDLGVRVASAIVLIPIILWVNWLGSIWYALLVGLMAGFMALEWVKLVHAGRPVQLAVHLAAAAVSTALLWMAGPAVGFTAILMLWAGSVVQRQIADMPHTFWSIIGVPYIGLSALALMILRGDPQFGLIAVYWLLFVVWGADTLAYFTGRLFGGPKLLPSISPKKTWAGLIGAIVGGILCSALFARVAGLDSLLWLCSIGAILAIIEQAGDFFESALKRSVGVKDSSALIPGHGGMLDRVDGLVAAAALAALIGCVRAGISAAGKGILLW
jgi:phosphatidate cytidylyltransferase